MKIAWLFLATVGLFPTVQPTSQGVLVYGEEKGYVQLAEETITGNTSGSGGIGHGTDHAPNAGHRSTSERPIEKSAPLGNEDMMIITPGTGKHMTIQPPPSDEKNNDLLQKRQDLQSQKERSWRSA